MLEAVSNYFFFFLRGTCTFLHKYQDTNGVPWHSINHKLALLLVITSIKSMMGTLRNHRFAAFPPILAASFCQPHRPWRRKEQIFKEQGRLSCYICKLSHLQFFIMTTKLFRFAYRISNNISGKCTQS